MGPGPTGWVCERKHLHFCAGLLFDAGPETRSPAMKRTIKLPWHWFLLPSKFWDRTAPSPVSDVTACTRKERLLRASLSFWNSLSIVLSIAPSPAGHSLWDMGRWGDYRREVSHELAISQPKKGTYQFLSGRMQVLLNNLHLLWFEYPPDIW